jgi:mono/diheme cytochrome c family protein
LKKKTNHAILTWVADHTLKLKVKTMRKSLLILISFSLAFSVPVRADGLLGFLFGGRRRQVVQQQYYQPTYQQTYQPTYQYQQYQAVATIPLATIPVAVDLQAYQYQVNASAFQSFREYMANKSVQPEQQQQSQPSEAAPVAPRPTSTPEETRVLGAQVLQRNCIGCHQESKNPKKGFAIFDKTGNMFTKLPFDEMLERISSTDPEIRMPPKKQLATADVLAVFKMAHSLTPSSPQSDQQPTRTASNVPWNPLD